MMTTAGSPPHSAIAVRAARPDDAEAIADIQVHAWRAAFAGLIPEAALAALDSAPRAARWRQMLGEPGPAISLLALDETGQPVGFCVYGVTRDRDGPDSIGEVVVLDVLPAAWRRGVGRALCAVVEEDAVARGWSELTLWAVQANRGLAAFCEKLGFKADGGQRLDMRMTQFPLSEIRYRRAVTAARLRTT